MYFFFSVCNERSFSVKKKNLRNCGNTHMLVHSLSKYKNIVLIMSMVFRNISCDIIHKLDFLLQLDLRCT
jgi:CMP-N-acetylneuraminic acid synthetase